jgi:arylsulfatase
MATSTETFQGKINRTRDQSEPWWPPLTRAPGGAPNIVIILMDDMGYSDPGCFGGEIDTPNIDALAARGVRFNHYTTHPICSPARAALLTGRNAHSVSTGWLANNNAGFPGYSGEIPREAPTLAETLRAQGYGTMMVGKWHNTPIALSTPGSPKDSWPTQRGFDWYYGFMEGETNFFFPARLMLGNSLLPIDEYPKEFYTTDAWTDKAIEFVREHRTNAPGKPFFLYVANNAVHAPLQAKPADLAKYRGRFDAGWTALREARWRRQLALGLIPPGTRLADSDPTIPAWDDVPREDRELFARHMEVYAAMLDSADQNIGKLTQALKAGGDFDNTIFVFTSDNGGTFAGTPIGAFRNNRRYNGLPAQPIEEERKGLELLGGPQSEALYPAGWGQVCNTPFPSSKSYTGGGGRRVAFVMVWEKGIPARGELRQQFAHVTDVKPTLLDLAGLKTLERINGVPAWQPHGKSFAAVLRDPNASSPRSEQYYECWANRAYYRDGWLARSLQKRGEAIDMDNWTLHDLKSDFSESIDLRARHPDKLRELTDAFDKAAWENLVYPLDNRSMVQKLADAATRGQPSGPRTFRAGGQTIHRGVVVPLIADRSYRISTRIEHGAADQGVLWSVGELIAGMVLYIENGALRFFYNGFGEFSELPPAPLAAGAREVTFDYEATGGRKGRGRLLIDGQPAMAWQPLSPSLMGGFHEGMDIGLDRRCPVDWRLFEKHGVFRYSGAITEVTIAPGELSPDSVLRATTTV